MKDFVSKSLSRVIVFALFSATRLAYAPPPPSELTLVDVAGEWIICAKDPNGTTSTKYVDLTQKGNTLGGQAVRSN